MSNDPPPQTPAAPGFLAQLKGLDDDRYCACLFAGPAVRTDLAALFLFNAELARIRDQVSEPILGQMRLQWWRDGLLTLGTGAQPPHALLDHLAALARRGIDLAPLHDLIDARAFDLQETPFPDMESYRAYIAATSHPLGDIAAAILGRQDAAPHRQAMEHYAQIGLLRAIPFRLRWRQLLLPPDALTASGIDPEAVLAGQDTPALAHLIKTLTEDTQGRILRLRQAIRTLPVAQRRDDAAILLMNDLAALYAGRLQSVRYDIFARKLAQPHPLRLPYMLLRAAMM